MTNPVVKSAQRTLEVLEFFALHRRPATVTEVSVALDYPQSSTSMLLASLETLGYLRYSAGSRRYHATLRVMLLGAWMQDAIFGEGSLAGVMQRLRRQTGQTVMIGLRQGLSVRYIMSLPGSNAGSVGRAPGSVISVCLSAMGKVLLAEEKDAEVARIASRSNALAHGPAECVAVPALVGEIRRCRQTGWARSLDFPRAGRAALAVPLPRMPGQPPMALGIGASKERIQGQTAALIAYLQDACAELHGATSASQED